MVAMTAFLDHNAHAEHSLDGRLKPEHAVDDEEEEGSLPPDLIAPTASIHPVDLVVQSLRGFCVPNNNSNQNLKNHDIRSIRTDVSDSPRRLRGQRGKCGEHDDDEYDDDSILAPEYSVNGDHDILVVKEIPGTRRIVRVVAALEIFFAVIACLCLTVLALKSLLGVNNLMAWELRPKLDGEMSAERPLFWLSTKTSANNEAWTKPLIEDGDCGFCLKD